MHTTTVFYFTPTEKTYIIPHSMAHSNYVMEFIYQKIVGVNAITEIWICYLGINHIYRER